MNQDAENHDALIEEASKLRDERDELRAALRQIITIARPDYHDADVLGLVRARATAALNATSRSI